MVDSAKFVNVKINVDGKIQNVKVEKGVYFNSCFVEGENKISKYEATEPNYNNDVGLYYDVQLKHINQIDMSAAEFSIFKNFANNNAENGNEIILSKKDIEMAEDLFYDGKFTKDISKNLPEGYAAYKDWQDINTYDDYSNNDVTSRTEITASITNSKSNKVVNVNYSKDGVDPELKRALNNSKNGKVRVDCGAEDEAFWINGYEYIDKNGKKHRFDTYDNRDYTWNGKDWVKAQ